MAATITGDTLRSGPVRLAGPGNGLHRKSHELELLERQRNARARCWFLLPGKGIGVSHGQLGPGLRRIGKVGDEGVVSMWRHDQDRDLELPLITPQGRGAYAVSGQAVELLGAGHQRTVVVGQQDRDRQQRLPAKWDGRESGRHTPSTWVRDQPSPTRFEKPGL